MKRKVYLLAVLSVAFAVFAAKEAIAQKRVVQLSGVVLAADSINPLPGVRIYVPAAGRGGMTNISGFFSLPLVIGDSVVFSSVGFKRKSFTIPENSPEYSTLIVIMNDDTTYLPDVVILAYPTEEVFKQSILAMNDPKSMSPIDGSQMNSELMALMIRTTPMDAAANYKYYMSQYPTEINQKFQPITNPFLNIVNWAKFFKQLKQQKKEKDIERGRNRIPD